MQVRLTDWNNAKPEMRYINIAHKKKRRGGQDLEYGAKDRLL